MESLQDSFQTRIPPAAISNVLAGRRSISQQNAVRLEDYFGVSPVAFLVAGGGKAI